MAGCSRGPASLEHGSYVHEQVDVGDAAQVRRWIRSVRSAHTRIDALVCNAALIPTPALVGMMAEADLAGVLRTNVQGTYLVCQEVSRVMRTQRSGRIVTLSSMAAAVHQEGTAAYAASKAAVVEFTKVLARELGGSGITCNVVAPSIVETEGLEALDAAAISKAMDALTIKRALDVAEVGAVVEFLLRPESACVTGQVLHLGMVA